MFHNKLPKTAYSIQRAYTIKNLKILNWTISFSSFPSSFQRKKFLVPIAINYDPLINKFYNCHATEQLRPTKLQNLTFDFTRDSVGASNNIFL